MTPTEKGAFCGKCAIDVIDFSNKSNLEIKNILENNKGKHMCGRFKTSQLNDFNTDYNIWHNQTTSTFQSKFIYAAVLAFGLSLFSCSPSNHDHILGEIEQITSVIDTITNIKSNQLQDTSFTTKDSNKTSHEQNLTCPPPNMYFEMGDIEYTPDIEPEKLLGEIAIEHENDSLPMGKIKVTEPELEPIGETTVISTIGIVEPLPDISSNNYSAQIYNDSHSNSGSIDIFINQSVVVKIYITNTTGEKVILIHDGLLKKGHQIFSYDLDSFGKSEYTINFITAEDHLIHYLRAPK